MHVSLCRAAGSYLLAIHVAGESATLYHLNHILYSVSEHSHIPLLGEAKSIDREEQIGIYLDFFMTALGLPPEHLSLCKSSNMVEY